MKHVKSNIVIGGIIALAITAVSAQAGTFTVGAEGIGAGSVNTTVNNPAHNVDLKENVKGYGVNASYGFGDGYDVSLAAKALRPTNRQLSEIRVDGAKTIDFGNFGKLRVAPVGFSYAQHTMKDLDNVVKEYNLYYSPSITYTKDLGYNVFAQAGYTYNYGLVSHYKNGLNSADNYSIPKSNGYEGLVKVGYNVTKEASVTLAYNRAKYDFAGDSRHYDTKAEFKYFSLGVNYSF